MANAPHKLQSYPLRMPAELRAQLDLRAAVEGKTLRELIIEILENEMSNARPE